MDKTQALATLQGIFRDVLDDATVVLTPRTSAKDVEGWDSLAHINLVVAIEKHYKIRFAITELQTLQNVGDMVDLIERKLPQ
jgi:acyl carrier protein